MLIFLRFSSPPRTSDSHTCTPGANLGRPKKILSDPPLGPRTVLPAARGWVRRPPLLFHGGYIGVGTEDERPARVVRRGPGAGCGRSRSCCRGTPRMPPGRLPPHEGGIQSVGVRIFGGLSLDSNLFRDPFLCGVHHRPYEIFLESVFLNTVSSFPPLLFGGGASPKGERSLLVFFCSS